MNKTFVVRDVKVFFIHIFQYLSLDLTAMFTFTQFIEKGKKLDNIVVGFCF